MKKAGILFCFFLTFLTACTPALPTVVPTLTPSPLPTLTPTPSPTPTATPIPPLVLTIHPPERVSALRPVPIEVELVPPPGIVVTATVHATVLTPGGAHYQSFELHPAGNHRYISTEPLQLPLLVEKGDWQLDVVVQSRLPVSGERRLLFRPDSIRCRDLSEILPLRVDVCVPQDFVEFAAQGDQVAGKRVWRYEQSELGLWWAPGPVEPLLFNNALVMVEATYGLDAPAIQRVEETKWVGRRAFLFYENWPGPEGGRSEALVAQAPDYRLYVLRIRALGTEVIPPFLYRIRETLTWIGKRQ